MEIQIIENVTEDKENVLGKMITEKDEKETQTEAEDSNLESN